MSNPKPEEKTYMAWSKDDVVRLVGWMEENQEELRGQQKKWHKDIKEEVFVDESIIVNRIRVKVSNMKAAWSMAKKSRDQSGWGLKPEDHSDSQQSFLEKKFLYSLLLPLKHTVPLLIADILDVLFFSSLHPVFCSANLASLPPPAAKMSFDASGKALKMIFLDSHESKTPKLEDHDIQHAHGGLDTEE
ncbi:hypothetical protein EV426DRAFT_706406 [Tirmania nivea]|nr:hypothetical protein EV426DRAFT_706406 [Tirmania nivea]